MLRSIRNYEKYFENRKQIIFISIIKFIKIILIIYNIKKLENYINEDDMIIKTEILISIFKNIEIIKDQDFINLYIEAIENFMDSSLPKENCHYRENMFFNLIEDISENNLTEKIYFNIIKNYFKKNIIIYDKDTSITTPRDSSQQMTNKISTKYEILLQKIKQINNVFKLHNEMNFMTDFIVYLIKSLFDQNNSQNMANGYINNNFSNNNTCEMKTSMNVSIGNNTHSYGSSYSQNSTHNHNHNFNPNTGYSISK